MTDPFTPERSLTDRVDEWLRRIANDDEIFNLLKLSIGRVVVNRKIEDFRSLDQEAEACRRWIARAIEMKSEWLGRVDDLGRPKKLLKFSDVPGIVKEVRKSQVKEAQHFARTVVSDIDEEWFADLEGGFHLVKLKTRRALLREGGTLQNCLGDGDYDEHLANGEYQYFVLRDERGRSHAIAEVRSADNLVWEFRGKQNVSPKMKYLAPFARFITEREWPIINRWRWGFVIDDQGRVLQVDSLPDKLNLRGDLKFFNCEDIVLPRELVVTGFLHFRKSSISVPSEEMSARTIVVESSSGGHLARHVVVRDFLELKPDADLAYIGDVVSVDGPLQMDDNEHIQFMPDHLRVADWFGGRGTRFKEFGADTRIRGCINMRRASAAGTFSLDADRHVVQVGDTVEIIDNVRGVNGVNHGDLRGKFASLVEPMGHDGGILEYPGADEARTISMVASSFRKVPRLPISALESCCTQVSNDGIVVDLFPERAASPLNDDYDFDDFDFDLIFGTDKD